VFVLVSLRCDGVNIQQKTEFTIREQKIFKKM